jgi:hypothetical protein
VKLAYLSARDIEERAEQVLAEYARRSGRPIAHPIPIDRIVDQVFDLPVLWEEIPPSRGKVHPSKLVQPSLGSPARIVLNEALLDSAFRQHPGLERTALAHEAGHAAFHLERSGGQQLGLGFSDPVERPSFESDLGDLTDGLDRALAMRGPVGDDWWREWQAHTFMRFVLMPRRLLLPLLEDGGYCRWIGNGGLYDLRNRFDVTISALVVHLAKLGYARVDDRRVIHDVTAQVSGQRALGL